MKPKLFKEQGEVEAEDRISNLPCSIITEILSFLPLKSAVATSVLSTRWKEMWKETTNLELHDELLRPQTSGTTQSPQLQFSRFVYRMLNLRRYRCLHKFHLKCGKGYEAQHVNRWLAYAVKCGVRELHVSVHMPSVLLPSCLFSCKTLVDLKLVENFVIDVPSDVSLPCLKFLDIDGPKFSHNESITRLFSGCPALEKLSMKGCIGVGVEVVRISAPVLMSLIICNFAEGQDSSDCYEIKLETPMLSYLYIHDCIAEGYEFGDLENLVEASIRISRPSGNRDEFPYEEKYLEAINNLFEAISEVQQLSLNSHTIEAIQVYCHEVEFPELIDLYLGVETTEEDQISWDWLIRTLANSPKLRSLTFKKGFIRDPCYECSLGNDDGVLPHCELFGLKKIEIRKFYEQPCEFEMLEFFLENAKSLEEVVIHVTRPYGRDLIENLSLLPRPSEVCRMRLITH